MVLAGILLLLGVSLIACPMLVRWSSEQSTCTAIQKYQTRLQEIDLEEEKQLAKTYNDRLRENQNLAAEYNDILDIHDGIMGVIRIPSIYVELPVYHGVSDEVLAKGVGHLPQSSLPVGGEGNHSVLTGHTGYPGATLFTDLTRLREGDMFYLSVLGETLAYCVDQIKVVLPEEGEDLAAAPGKDYCTLVTCTPYGVNSHRLLVRGVRTEAMEAQ